MSEKLVVMPSNNTGTVVRQLADRFPGRLAHLISPGGWRNPLLPYALDNHKRRIPRRCTCGPCAYWFSLLGHTLPEHCANPEPAPPEPEKP